MSVPEGNSILMEVSADSNFGISQGTYLIKEHMMPNYAVPLLMKVKDKFMNVQKVKTRLDGHIKTVFESSYTTEVCEFN